MIKRCAFLSVLLTLMMLTQSFSAPMWGEMLSVKQPDGSRVEVKVYGDEFYRRLESADGYTLIKDPKTGWICYADLSADSSEFISTGRKYISSSPVGTYQSDAVQAPDSLPKGLKLSEKARLQIIRQQRKENPQNISPQNLMANNGVLRDAATPGSNTVSGDIKGITVLIDFPDDTATIPQAEVDSMLNQLGYANYGNNGSLRDYFLDVSGGQLDYTNTVVNYIRAPQPKSYYNTPWTGTTRVKEMLQDILVQLDAQYDFSTLSADNTGMVRGVNFYYAGARSVDWGVGLWPHQGTLIGAVTLDGVEVHQYQITDIDTCPTIGVFAHENGHLIMGWPDTYDYDYSSYGTGKYCLMSSSNEGNPQIPNMVFRVQAGWATKTDISSAVPGTVFTHETNSNSCYYYSNPTNPHEAFYIESRMKRPYPSGHIRWQMDDEGLMIWHYDSLGNKNYEHMQADKHYKLSLEQANGLFVLERGVKNNLQPVPPTCLFRAGNAADFHDCTLPNSLWWDGTASGLQLVNISAVQEHMSFTIGNVAPQFFTIETAVNRSEKVVPLPSNGKLLNGATSASPTGGGNFGTVAKVGDKIFADIDGAQNAVEIASAGGWWIGMAWNNPYQGAGCSDCPLSVVKDGGIRGRILPAGPVSAFKNSLPDFVIQPDPGYGVKDVRIDGVSYGEVYELKFPPVYKDHLLEVDFAETDTLKYDLWVSIENGYGKTFGSGNYASGSVVEVRYKPHGYFSFSHWKTADGFVIFDDSTQNPTNLVVGSNAIVNAVINPPGILTIETVGSGTVTGGGMNYTKKSLPVTATPAAGYRFSKWSVVNGDIAIANPLSSNTDVVMTNSATIVAEFVLQ